MLGGVHTADLGAVALSAVIGTAGAHTLDKYHGLGSPVIRHTLQMALCGTRRVHDTLQLQGGNHIRTLAVSIFVIFIKLNRIEARGYHDSSVIFRNDLILLLIVNGSGLADLRADAAFSGLELDAVLPVNDRHVGDGLGKRRVDGASLIKSPVELVGRLFGRAFLLADAAARTLAHIHASGFLPDFHMKIAHKACHLLHLAVGVNGDVFVGCRLHHLRRQDTGRAVQGREGLVKLGHSSADTRRLFYNVHLVAGLGNVKGRLDAGDTAANHESPFHYPAGPGRQGRVQHHLRDGRPRQNNGLLCGFLSVFMYPGTVLADIRDLYHVGI